MKMECMLGRLIPFKEYIEKFHGNVGGATFQRTDNEGLISSYFLRSVPKLIHYADGKMVWL